MKGTCDNCGNYYEKNFGVLMDGKEYFFDCFECAINKLAPHCSHCDTTIIGHGVEASGKVYCCHHCSAQDEARLEWHEDNTSPSM